MKLSDIASAINAYELGELEDHEVVDLFQDLVDTGLVWSLQGSYGRTAQGLIDQGLVVPQAQVPR